MFVYLDARNNAANFVASLPGNAKLMVSVEVMDKTS